MLGVSLEGGGARGAYHVGAIRALHEAGYAFDGFSGTSIGAINAAVLAQGDFDRLHELWETITPTRLFSEPVARLMALGERIFSGNFAADALIILNEIRKEGIAHGIDTTQMKALIHTLVDEGRLRASGKLFALVTVCVSALKPYQLYLDEIADGQLVEYLMASASFPGFQPQVIGEEMFVDGGLFNNCPVNLLTDRGFERVVAIRTRGPGVFWLPRHTQAQIDLIEPSRDLGNVMSFDNGLSRTNMKIGYLDAKRFLGGLSGNWYYIKTDRKVDFDELMLRLDDDTIRSAQLGRPLPDLPARRLLFEGVLPRVGARLKLPEAYSYEDLGLSVLEYSAKEAGLDALQELSLHQLAAHIVKAPPVDEPGEAAALHALARGMARKILDAHG